MMGPWTNSRGALRGGLLADKTQDWKTWFTVSFGANLLLILVVLLCLVPGKQPSTILTDPKIGDSLEKSEKSIQDLKQQLQSIVGELGATRDKLRSALPDGVTVKPSTGPPALPAGQGFDKLWLTIGITTIPRKNDTDYLTETLSTIFSELPEDATDPLYGRVKILLMNNRPGQHVVFQAIRQRMFDGQDSFARKARLYLHTVDNPGTVKDPAPHLQDPDDMNNPSNRPGREVRQQTCDLIALLEAAHPLSHYYMFMEDDFRLCPHALRVLQYVVRKLNTAPKMQNWLALRISYGMNGILLRNSLLPSFTAYLRKNTARLPPDLIWTEWYAGKKKELWAAVRGHPLVIYKWNLLEHIGSISSFTIRVPRPAFPRCWEPMATVWSIGKTERFDARRCNHTDISPCPRAESDEAWTDSVIEWPRLGF